MNNDDLNLYLATTNSEVDRLNQLFYERFQYPPPPVMLSTLSDANFEVRMLNQSVGSWDHSLLRDDLKIWIAGCGRNQGFITGLRFPKCSIVASDLSTESLASERRAAENLKLTNVEFRHESINDVGYREQFDYVLCTGVIHHNADPSIPLKRLAAALKPDGILELMVYNRYHRIQTTAFQKAIRLLSGSGALEDQLRVAKRVIGQIGVESGVADALREAEEVPESAFADTWLQPVEHSYTVESLRLLLDECGLEYVAPCVNQFDKVRGTFLWQVPFSDVELARHYFSLPDLDRWRIANHLLMEKSPMLWFYCARKGNQRYPLSEHELCDQFLARKFARARTRRKMYYVDERSGYVTNDTLFDHPGRHPDPQCRSIIEAIAAEPKRSVADVMRTLGLPVEFGLVNRLRQQLTSSEYPYLISV